MANEKLTPELEKLIDAEIQNCWLPVDDSPYGYDEITEIFRASLTRVAEQAQREERERCAKVAEEELHGTAGSLHGYNGLRLVERIAAAIRGGQHGS